MNIWQQERVVLWSQILINSYRNLVGKDLIFTSQDPMKLSQMLFEAPFVVVSHDSEIDPILNYGNCQALELWEMSWDELIKTPSRLTAEPASQEERQKMLELVTQQGFVSNYQGIRISNRGKRFKVKDTVIWNLQDLQGNPCGQGATFSQWEFLS